MKSLAFLAVFSVSLCFAGCSTSTSDPNRHSPTKEMMAGKQSTSVGIDQAGNRIIRVRDIQPCGKRKVENAKSGCCEGQEENGTLKVREERPCNGCKPDKEKSGCCEGQDENGTLKEREERPCDGCKPK